MSGIHATMPATEKFNAWNLYQQLIEKNAMEHQAMYAKLREVIQETVGNNSFSVLDLGCGDARYASNMLAGLPIEFYCGFDLSNEALQLAQDHVAKMKRAFELKQGHYPALMKNTQHQFSFILCAYSLHNLSLVEKDKFFNQCKRLLARGGILAIIDMLQEEKESRAQFIQRHKKFIIQANPELTQEHHAGLAQYLEDHDYPETFSMYKQMAIRNGLRHFSTAHRAGFFELMTCKNAYAI